mmetsp:Transcript_98729/g.195749  ORF Transcript_98729/g.195749 Transcript_98729/m.195749 type:complete len:149 (-) Transcript_98729:171-617(-)
MAQQLHRQTLRPPPGLAPLLAHGLAADTACSRSRTRRRREQRKRHQAQYRQAAFQPMDVVFDIFLGLEVAGAGKVPMAVAAGIAQSVKLVAVAEGTLDGMQAFMEGRLKVEGNMRLAQKIPGILEATRKTLGPAGATIREPKKWRSGP